MEFEMEGIKIKGFKVFNPNWTCRGFQYEVGKTYEEDVIPSVCNRGFHFCKQAKDCFNYYSFDPENKVAEVLALGEVVEDGDKCCTNKIHIVREITWEELLTIVNTGKGNAGLCNTGDYNTGNWNTGDYNTGDYNTGTWNTGYYNTGDYNTGDYNTGTWNTCDYNTGNRNTGNRNTGYYNTGDYNTGNWNTGNWNTGDYNTGTWNTGNRNTGNRNTGYYNTGDYNTGDYNTGNWNTGNFCTGDFNISDHETGCFCTEEHKIRFFDKESDMTFKQWINSEAYQLLRRIQFEPSQWIWSEDMTDEEKAAHPEHEVTGGYLKVCNTDKAFINWWNSLTNREKKVIKNIPNFNAEKFELITGIKVV
jgi:hypothetical protein